MSNKALRCLVVLWIASSARAQNVPAEAEVSASSGPIKLTLSVYRTKLHLGTEYVNEMDWKQFEKDHPGKEVGQVGNWKSYEHPKPRGIADPLWIRLRVTNVGKKPIVISDHLFTGRTNFAAALTDNLEHKMSFYVEVLGPDGKPVRWSPQVACPRVWSKEEIRAFNNTPEQISRRRRYDALGKKWVKAGYSREKMQNLLDKVVAEENAKKEPSKEERAARAIEEEKEQRRLHPNKNLAPGESATTASFVAPGLCPTYRAVLPSPIGDFAELWNYHIHEAGSYKIRAMYEGRPLCSRVDRYVGIERTVLQEDCRKGLISTFRATDMDVFVRVPPISIEVHP